MLGLLREPEAIAARVIVAQGASLDAVREAATTTLPAPLADPPSLIPYDTDAKKVLELTFRHALRLGHNDVGTEHLLLALLDHEDGDGVLTAAGVDAGVTERQIRTLLADIADPTP